MERRRAVNAHWPGTDCLQRRGQPAGDRSVIRPARLKPGARVAIVSPASTPKEPLVRLGMERFASLRYEPVLFPSALASGPLYYAGDVAFRVKDLHDAFSDPSIEAIICTRGGWGTAELLPHLDADLI